MISSRSRRNKSQSRCLLLPLVNPRRTESQVYLESKIESRKKRCSEELQFQEGDYLEKKAV